MLNKQYSTVIESEFFSLKLDEDKLFGDVSNDTDYTCNSISISEDPFLKWWADKRLFTLNNNNNSILIKFIYLFLNQFVKNQHLNYYIYFAYFDCLKRYFS